MTAEEFKKANPQYAHLEGNALWDAMEDSLLQSGNRYTPYEHGGYIEEVSHSSGGTLTMRNPRFWINLSNGDIIPNSTVTKWWEPRPMPSDIGPCKMIFLDLSKNPNK